MTGAASVRGARRAGFAAALLLAAAATASFASLPETSSEPRPLRVAEEPPFLPGQVVHLSWDPLPAEAEEFEILLTADLPRPLRLRLTESKEPSCRRLAVVLPALPSCTGRFLLRAGSLRGEFLFAESPPWVLRSPWGAPVAPAVEKGGELWAGKVSSPRGLHLDPRRSSAGEGYPGGSAAVLSETTLLPPRGGFEGITVVPHAHFRGGPPASPAAHRSPAFPLRI